MDRYEQQRRRALSKIDRLHNSPVNIAQYWVVLTSKIPKIRV